MNKITCSKCGKLKELSSKRYCNFCAAEYMREWRKSNPLSIIQREKMNTRSYLHVYIKRGLIIKQPCSICFSAENLEAHHPDYSKPLEVIWFCRKHHIEHHRYLLTQKGF